VYIHICKGKYITNLLWFICAIIPCLQHHKSIFSIRELRHLKNLEAKRSNQYILQLFCTCLFSQSLLWTDFSTWFSNRSNHEGDHVASACKLLLIVWVDFEIHHVVIPKRTTLLLLVPSCFSLLGCLTKFNNMLSSYPRGSYCSSNCFQLVVPETPISNFLFPNSGMWKERLLCLQQEVARLY